MFDSFPTRLHPMAPDAALLAEAAIPRDSVVDGALRCHQRRQRTGHPVTTQLPAIHVLTLVVTEPLGI